MMIHVPGWRMHWGVYRWNGRFGGNVVFRSALKRMGAADWKVYQVGQASCNDL